LVNPTDYKI